MFRLVKKMYVRLLNSIVSASNHAKTHIVEQSEMYNSTYFY